MIHIPNEPPSKANTCAVVVTYNPDDEIAVRIRRIASQVTKVVLIDNHSGHSACLLLRNISRSPRFILIENASNFGVATALNMGMEWAKDNHFKWVLLFDQDTLVNITMLHDLNTVFNAIKEDCRSTIGIIGSNYLDTNSLKALIYNSNKLWLETKTVITSGSLISLSAYCLVGRFRDDFFIDFVDIEYCLRARSMGLSIVIATKPMMKHAVGSISMHRLPWKTTGTSNHQMVRRYYMVRNFIFVAKKYAIKEPLWFMTVLLGRIKMVILILLYERKKLHKLKYILLGVVDGLCNKVDRAIN